MLSASDMSQMHMFGDSTLLGLCGPMSKITTHRNRRVCLSISMQKLYIGFFCCSLVYLNVTISRILLMQLSYTYITCVISSM